MKKTTRKVWLQYSMIGFIASFVIVLLFESFPSIRILSNEAAVFGVMFATMKVAIDKMSKVIQSE